MKITGKLLIAATIALGSLAGLSTAQAGVPSSLGAGLAQADAISADRGAIHQVGFKKHHGFKHGRRGGFKHGGFKHRRFKHGGFKRGHGFKKHGGFKRGHGFRKHGGYKYGHGYEHGYRAKKYSYKHGGFGKKKFIY